MWVHNRAKTTGNGGRHGIDLNGAAGGQIAGQQSYGNEDQRRNQKGKRIGWAYSDQHGAEESKANESTRNSDQQSGEGEDEALEGDHLQYFEGAGAEGHADSEFLSALA